MDTLETASAPVAYKGHVRNGRVVLDVPVELAEGQEVRVEPVQPTRLIGDSRAAQLEEMKRLFAQWDEEDRQIPDEVAEEFHRNLQVNRLQFRTPNLD